MTASIEMKSSESKAALWGLCLLGWSKLKRAILDKIDSPAPILLTWAASEVPNLGPKWLPSSAELAEVDGADLPIALVHRASWSWGLKNARIFYFAITGFGFGLTGFYSAWQKTKINQPHSLAKDLVMSVRPSVCFSTKKDWKWSLQINSGSVLKTFPPFPKRYYFG